jgi:hypothetical protein
MKVYIANNTGLWGTRYIAANSIEEATQVALDIKMVKCIENLKIEEMDINLYKNYSQRNLTHAGVVVVLVPENVFVYQ